MAIVSKQDLRNNLLSAFPDNNSELITPAVLREYLEDFVDSNLSEERAIIDSSSATINEFTDAVVLLAGASNVTLPDVLFYVDRALTIINSSGGSITLDGEGIQTINGLTTYEIFNNSYVILTENDAIAGDWAVLLDTGRSFFIDLLDTPSDYTGAAGQEVIVNNAEDALEFTPRPPQLLAFQAAGKDPDDEDYLGWGSEIQGNQSHLVIPFDGEIIQASLGRTDTDDSILELLVNGVVEDEFFTTEASTVYGGLNIPVSAGDEIEVRVKNNENKINNPIFVIVLAIDGFKFPV